MVGEGANTGYSVIPNLNVHIPGDRPALSKMGCSLKAGLHKGVLYIAPVEAAQHGIMQACRRWTHLFETPHQTRTQIQQ